MMDIYEAAESSAQVPRMALRRMNDIENVEQSELDKSALLWYQQLTEAEREKIFVKLVADNRIAVRLIYWWVDRYLKTKTNDIDSKGHSMIPSAIYSRELRKKNKGLPYDEKLMKEACSQIGKRKK